MKTLDKISFVAFNIDFGNEVPDDYDYTENEAYIIRDFPHDIIPKEGDKIESEGFFQLLK